MAEVLLSPHLDDAVLSCWRALDRPEPATVVNVFSSAPPAGAPVGWWDRITGASDSAARMREREAEDGEALAVAGARARDLRLLDHQYRSTSIGAADLAAALEPRLTPMRSCMRPPRSTATPTTWWSAMRPSAWPRALAHWCCTPTSRTRSGTGGRRG